MTDYSKPDLRAHYRQIRANFVENLADSERTIAFRNPPKMLTERFIAGKIVAGYVPVGFEANPLALLEIAEEMGCQIALPHVVNRTAPMRFLHWKIGAPLFDGPFGLSQPASEATSCSPDIVLVPLVAFDRSLMRLGQGAGHYDRALSLLDDALAIGVAWSAQEAPILPSDPWDIPLNAILTEKAWIAA